MQEALKHNSRRLKNDFFEKYIKGKGIDIGCGAIPFHSSAIGYDLIINSSYNADGNFPYEDSYFDYVHSSHCLEHLNNPEKAIQEWWRVLKTFGYFIILVPDFGLYEQRQWPSCWSGEHKTYWNLLKLTNFVSILPGIEIISVNKYDTNYSYKPELYDRTLGTEGVLADIELIAQKVPLNWMFRSNL
jgi:SAM-dependent methyltransferase